MRAAGRDDARRHRWVDAVVLGAVLLVVGLHVPLSLLLSPTITAGGDTPSHYYTLQYLVTVLLPSGRLSGWSPSAYAGFPLLEFYFPLPFLVMAACSTLMSLPVAFKVGTLLGVFGLPLAAYACLRCLRVPFPGPAIGAVSTLPFLFSETTSIWGGNIPSVLAGEFAYSLGLALAVAWIGSLSAGIVSGRWAGLNALLLALVGLSHGYPLLLAGAFSLTFLVGRTTFPARLAYLLRVHGQALLVMSVWLLPLLAHLRWTTAYDFTWDFSSWWRAVFPSWLWPQAALAGAAVAMAGWRWVRTRTPEPATWTIAAVGAWGLVLYAIAPALGVVDVRFLPFVQLAVSLLAALGLMRLTRPLRGQPLLPLLALAATAWWVSGQIRDIPHWIAWNYSGLQAKPQWNVYAAINERLRGSEQDPRVAYEHSLRHDALGSVRIWESLPLFSGRATLEHAYFQASPVAPMVFYLQSELSTQVSCPFPRYGCTTINLDRAREHLALFNVRELLVISDEVKRRLATHPEYRLAFAVPPYEVYETSGPHRYVEPLRDEPVVWTGGHWKQTAYAWFRHAQSSDVFLVFPIHRRDWTRFRLATEDLAHVPVRPLAPRGAVQWERLSRDAVEFETTALHHPHLIKVSYHPNWRVEGAPAIHVVSPAFMLVYPDRPRVRLWYARSGWEFVGLGLTGLGVGLLWLRRGRPSHPRRSQRIHRRLSERAWHRLWGVTLAVVAIGLAGLGGLALDRRLHDPPALLGQAERAKAQQQWARAERALRHLLRIAPQSTQAEFARYQLGILHYLQQHWEQALVELEELTAQFPDSHLLAEAFYHMALCAEALGRTEERQRHADALRTRFPDTPWAQYARERWPPRAR